LLFLLAAPAFAGGEDSYYDMAFPDLVTAPSGAHVHVHVCVVGFVASKPRREKDGDVHVKLCQGSMCLTLEIIPEVPIPAPRRGQKIQACGLSYFDGWHQQREIHPLLKWEARP
jgi:hypothetical protein